MTDQQDDSPNPTELRDEAQAEIEDIEREASEEEAKRIKERHAGEEVDGSSEEGDDDLH